MHCKAGHKGPRYVFVNRINPDLVARGLVPRLNDTWLRAVGRLQLSTSFYWIFDREMRGAIRDGTVCCVAPPQNIANIHRRRALHPVPSRSEI